MKSPPRKWQGIAGVYYPGEVVPSHIKIAKSESPLPKSSPTEQAKYTAGKRVPAARKAAAVKLYKKTGSMARVAASLRMGMRVVYAALVESGIKIKKPGQRSK